jgi:hypothetical protein
MKSIQELQARELAALNRAHEVARACPFPPRQVTSETSRAPWVSYKVQTLGEACDMLRAFTVLTWA